MSVIKRQENRIKHERILVAGGVEVGLEGSFGNEFTVVPVYDKAGNLDLKRSMVYERDRFTEKQSQIRDIAVLNPNLIMNVLEAYLRKQEMSL
jgi:hypothetical protein